VPNQLQDLTSKFYDNILLDEEYLQPDGYGNTNDVRHIQGLCLGRPGSGKSTLAHSIAETIVKKYGNDNSACHWSRADLHILLQHGLKDKLVNFLFLDDLTLAEIDSEDMSQYFQIRHLLKQKTGRRNGLVITLIGLHRLHAIPPSLRTNFDFLLFKSAPTNKYDRDFVKEYIGVEGIDLLDKLDLQRYKQKELFELGVIWLKGMGNGMIISKMPVNNYMTELVYGKTARREDSDELYTNFVIKAYLDSLKDDSKKNNWDGKE
jgi:Cdc6-like AAA superfamily ATPase